MTKKLNMVFKTDLGKEVTLTLADPKDDLTKAQVSAVMEEIVSKAIFTSDKGKLESVAEIVIKSTDEIALA
ncbi:DUF2922 domain-containing protein [Anaerosinus massiliensis]|uniref:DUF2922 domain-containing protein n=1 Tax=Massilibacillus massiliensis TaxID=1806837 RepID=UPI000DA62775|nr:DUF2922 domain-containing protein [Massilibacillus massiliensis]